MEVRPGYKRTEVEVIPEDWEVKKLLSLVLSHNSGIYKKRELYGQGCNIIGVSDLYGINEVDGQIFAQVPLSEQERAKHTLQHNDLLYGESSLVREGIARTVYVTEKGAGTAFAWHTRRYSVDQCEILSSFLCYYLQSQPARKHMLDNSIQTAITGINTEAYFACPVIIPPLPEQSAIAEALSDVDALIAALDRLIAKKRAIKQGAMQQLLTGQTRLPGFSEKSGYKQTEVGVIPGDWATLPVSSTVENIIDYRGRTPRKLGMEWGGGDIPALSAGNVKMGYIDFSEETYFGSEALYKRWMRSGDAKKDDIVVTMEAPLGNVALIPDEKKYILSQRTILLQTNQERVCNRFLLQLMSSQVFQRLLIKHATGSTAQGIQRKKFEKLEVILPPLPEQRAIAAVLSDMDAEIAALEARREKTRALKQGMMQELLTGRIRLV